LIGAWAAGMFKGKGTPSQTTSTSPEVAAAQTPSAPTKPPEIPWFPATPASKDQGKWRIVNDYLEQTTLDEHVFIQFGDKMWTDYDFTSEQLLARGNDQCCLVFRLGTWGNFCLFGAASFRNTCHTLEGFIDKVPYPAAGPLKAPGKLNAGV